VGRAGVLCARHAEHRQRCRPEGAYLFRTDFACRSLFRSAESSSKARGWSAKGELTAPSAYGATSAGPCSVWAGRRQHVSKDSGGGRNSRPRGHAQCGRESSHLSLYDGSYHDVDSNERAFKVAGSSAFKEAARKAKPILLEPVMAVEVTVPEEYMGTIIGDRNSRRGRIEGMEMVGDVESIKATGAPNEDARLLHGDGCSAATAPNTRDCLLVVQPISTLPYGDQLLF